MLVELSEKGFWAGDILCTIQYIMLSVLSDNDKELIAVIYTSALKALVDKGDIFAAYLLGALYQQYTDDIFTTLNNYGNGLLTRLD